MGKKDKTFTGMVSQCRVGEKKKKKKRLVKRLVLNTSVKVFTRKDSDKMFLILRK